MARQYVEYELYQHEDADEDLLEYDAHQTVIIRKKFLHFLPDHSYTNEQVPPLIVEWYPLCNSYYPYTEDVDAFNRVSHLLGGDGVRELDTVDIKQCIPTRKVKIPYSEQETQLEYLKSKPTCYLILGKPDVGEESLGRILAEQMGCVYVDPLVLVEEEIKSGSRAGCCIEFNLRCGRAVAIDVVLRLLQKRLNTETALHRGYVVCGFPLIQNDLYEEDPVSSETAVFTAQEIFEEIIDTVVPSLSVSVSKTSKGKDEESLVEGSDVFEEVEQEIIEPISPRAPKVLPADIGSTNESICFQPTIMGDYKKQLQFVFDLFENPYMIIYVSCPNADVVTKRASYRYNVMTQETIDLQAHEMNKFVYTLYSKETGGFKEPIELFDEYDQKGEGAVDFRYHLQLPKDFPGSVSTQLNRYHYAILKVIDKKVLLHKQGYFVKVDGRVSAARMFHMIKSKLRVTVPKAIIPIGMSDDPEEQLGETNNEPEQADNEEMTLEETFEKIRKKETASPLFKWTWSNWGKLCPVAMKDGVNIEGLPQFPVRFMNRIFFLSSEEAYVKFLRNPRPYLIPPYPKVVCKVFIMGPHRSGKSAVSKCLSYLFQSPILSPTALKREYCKQRLKEFRETVKSTALNEAIILLNKQRKEEWRRDEEQRLIDVQEWKDKVRELLEVLTSLDQRRSSLQEMSAFPLKLYDVGEEEDKIAGELTLARTIEELEALNITCTDDENECRRIAEEDMLLLRYLPQRLKRKPEREPATVFDDFVQEYVKKALREADPESVTLNVETMQEIFREKIREVQQGKEGWIIDDFKPMLELIESFDSDILPDDVIVLEDEPPYKLLVDRSKTRGLNYFNDYRKLFEKLDVPDVILNAVPKSSTTSVKQQVASDIIHDLVDQLPLETSETIEPEDEQIDSFAEYYSKVQSFCEVLSAKGVKITRLEISNKSLEEVLVSAVGEMRGRFRFQAKPFTSEDRLEEVENFGETGSEAGEGGEGGDVTKETEENFARNRRYGDTSFYCPVAFHDYFVLWKGKEELAVKLENRLYLCANESNMKKFLNRPYDYLTPNEPATAIPPMRICVTGPRMSGKTSIAFAIADNFGLYYVDLRKNVLKYVMEFDVNDEDLDNVQDYLNWKNPLNENNQKRCLSSHWFEEPIRSYGFVIDGYPMDSSDVEVMVKNNFIPSAIIQTVVNLEVVSGRVTAKYLAEWKNEMDAKQKLQDEENRQIMDEWEEKRAKRFSEMLEEKRAKRYEDKLSKKAAQSQDNVHTGLPDVMEVDDETDRSEVSLASVDEQADIDEINSILAKEMPEPVFEDNYETQEEAKTRLETSFAQAFEVEAENFRLMRELCDSELIPIRIVDGNLLLKQMVAEALRVCAPLQSNPSHLERCYEVSVEMAEKLLATGYYFPSRFNRTCPVQYFEFKIPIQLFLPFEQKFKIFPVIHRQYIYFIAGKENLDKFKQHPLKYVYQPCVNFPLIPYRISIIGPPKSGKSTLAERFQLEYGFKIITRGSAVRYVLSHLRHSKLAQDMEEVLHEGWELTDEMVMKSVDAAMFDGKAVTQGVVFDGFPNSPGEVRHLADLGLVPHVVVELQASLDVVFGCLKSDVVLKPNIPKYSERFIRYRYEEREKVVGYFRSWFEQEYQLLVSVEATPSKWFVWEKVRKVGLFSFYEVQFYFRCCKEDWPVRLHCMQVTPLEFLERRSSYRQYCPVCLYETNQLKNGGDTPDRSGLVQFRRYYYWICQEHLEDFLACPEQYLPPYNPSRLPTNLPRRVHPTERPGNVYANGICIICYKDGLPEMVLLEGKLNLAISYKGSIYLFCSYGCLKEFTKNPQTYSDVVVRKKRADGYPSLEYSDLPVLGLLEQFVAKRIVKVVTKVSSQRPIIPGLGPSASAAVFIGLHLKCQNENEDDKILELYRKAAEKMSERSVTVKKFLEDMKRVINPYVYYDEPMPPFRLPTKSTGKRQTVGYVEEYGEMEEERAKLDTKESSKSSVLGIIEELVRKIVG